MDACDCGKRGWKGLRILVTSEAALFRTTLRGFLNHLGHEVVTASSAADLEQRLAEPPAGPDLLITELDPGTPVMQPAMAILCRRHPVVPVLVVTQDGPTLSPEEALSYGVHGYLRKPLSLYELELALIRLDTRAPAPRDGR